MTDEKKTAKPAVKAASKSAAPKASAAKPAAKKSAKAGVKKSTHRSKPAGAPALKKGELKRPYRKTKTGYVVSDKMDKTIVVETEDRSKHPLYGKVVKRATKFKAHDEANAAEIGDFVLISETRPLSATKRWRLVEILEKRK